MVASTDADWSTVGVIADVHSNKVALNEVLSELSGVDGIVCAGDVVGYNPWPKECVESIRSRPIPTVQGNHDRAVATDSTRWLNDMARAGVEHARGELDSDHLAWLRGLPATRTACGGRIHIAHGHPSDPDRYTRPNEVSPEMIPDVADVLVLGHTHTQFHQRYEEGLVINPGSVGQPRDGDARAAFAVLDLDDLDVTDRRVHYDIDAVADEVERVGLPSRVGERLYEGW